VALQVGLPPAPGAEQAGRDEDSLHRALVERWLAGDDAALEQLLTSMAPRLLSICRQMCGDPADAADLCQDTLVKVIEGLPTFAWRSKLTTWMIRVTMNVCLTDRRRKRVRKTTSLSQFRDGQGPGATGGGQGSSGTGSGGESEGAGGVAGPGGWEPSTISRVEREEDLDRLNRAMSQLEPQSRMMLILRDSQQLEYAQIAEVLNVPIGTIKSRVFRARQALRERMVQGVWSGPVTARTRRDPGS